jgi:hypothetical protein
MRSNEEMSSQMRSYREPLGDGKRQKRFFRRWSRSCLNGESQGKPDKALGSSAFISGVPVEVAIERSQQKRVVTRENVPGAIVPRGVFYL